MRILVSSVIVVSALTAAALAAPLPQHEAQRAQARQNYEAGDWQQTITIASAILQANPQDSVALHLRGTAEIELGIAQQEPALIRTGIAHAREAITVAPTPEFDYYLPYLYGMSNLTRLEQQPDHATVAIEIAGQLLTQAGVTAEQKANVQYQRGLAQGALKQHDAAVLDFQAAITANPKHLASWMALADTQAEAGRTAEADKVYAQAVQAFPDEPLVHNNQGMFFQKTRRYNEAIRSFTAAIQKNPRYDIAIVNRGYTWLQGGRPIEAEKDFDLAMQISKPQPAVRSLRATARLAQGRWQDAVADYEVSIRENPEDPIAHADSGFARYFGKDLTGAIAEFNRVVQIAPDAKFINPWRMITLIRMGKSAEAATVAQPSRQKPVEERDWVDWLVVFHAGDITSEQLLTHIERQNTDLQAAQLCEARFFIAEQLAIRGQAQPATASYEQALQTGRRELSAFRGASYALKKFQ